MRVCPSQSRCRFGIARQEVTPPAGIYHRMWGAAEHDRSEGVHRPLMATVMYFGSPGDEQDAQLLVALDHCLLGVQEVASLLKQSAEQSGLPRGAITITFSHTHAAGLLNLDRQDLPGGELIPDYLHSLANTVGELSASAVRSATEANLVYANGHCRLASHRDYFDEQRGEFVCGFNPFGEADETVWVARVTDLAGNSLASFVNYACHPTTLAWDNRLISPDFPGAMRELVEQTTGGPCVFLQGASGDLGPVEGFVGDPEIADRNGRQLGYAVLSALEGLPAADTSFEYDGAVVSGALIGTWSHKPIDNGRLQEVSKWSSDRRVVELEYRHDLPRREAVEKEREQLVTQEEAARRAGDDEEAARLRALAERKLRMLGRLNGMPQGKAFPYETVLWRMGDAVWLAVQGEPYSLLQRQLRARFPKHPIMVATIANGWGPSYLPPRELYGKGVYQESIAALAPGSLETLIDNLAERIQGLLQ